MELIIIRHAEAHNIGKAGIGTDRGRALTPRGKKQARLVAERLWALEYVPDYIICSPFQRARETAEIIAVISELGEGPETCEFLCPGARADALIEWLATAAAGRVVVVGHAPDVEYITSAMLTCKKGLDIHFSTATACCLSFDDSPCLGGGRLEWLAPV